MFSPVAEIAPEAGLGFSGGQGLGETGGAGFAVADVDLAGGVALDFDAVAF